MAYQTVSSGTQIIDGVSYDLQYDPTNGAVQLIRSNAPAGTEPIYRDGSYTPTGNQLQLPTSTANAIHEEIKTAVYTAWQSAGGTANGAQLPPYAQPNATGGPGQNTANPQANPNSNGNSGQGTGTNLLGTLTQPFKTISAFAVNNNALWDSANSETLFRGSMKYPEDLPVGKQDLIKISAHRYVPVNQGLLTANNYQSSLTSGLQRGNDRIEQSIGTVFLPMPAGIQDVKSVSWGQGNLNTFNAAVASKYGNQAINPLTVLTTILGGALGGMGGAQTAAQMKEYAEALGTIGGDPGGSALIGAGLVDKITNFLGFGVDAETILARGAGIVSNQNTELLFQGPGLRTFSVAYRMTARSRTEAAMIRKIIRFFKQVSSPKKVRGGAGSASLFLGTPDVFSIEFLTTGNQEIAGVSRFKTCALTQITTDYTPDRQWMAFEDGQPVSTTLMLQFAELEPIYENDYQRRVSSSRSQTLRSVPDDSVGY